jgi:hypothetical protein
MSNDLNMLAAMERQAHALERMADAMESLVGVLSAKPVVIPAQPPRRDVVIGPGRETWGGRVPGLDGINLTPIELDPKRTR